VLDRRELCLTVTKLASAILAAKRQEGLGDAMRRVVAELSFVVS